MITKLNISGFKGFERLELPALSRVTLLGGRNNAGKTSILEAISMFFERLNPQFIFVQFSWRGIEIVPLEPEAIWGPLFLNYDMNKEITISAVINDTEEKMTIRFNPDYIDPVISAEASTTGTSAKYLQIKTDQKTTSSHALNITFDTKERKNQEFHLLIGPEGIIPRGQRDLANVKVWTIFVGSREEPKLSLDAERFGRLDIVGKQNKIVDFLKIIEPNLKSLSSIASGNTSIIHGDIGIGRKIPVIYMGDGVSRLLTIILSIATSQGGIVLLDEFENGIHYSVMPKVWEAIGRAAREFDCQVIGTTHSYECLEAAYKGFSVSEELQKDFSYIRIDKKGTKTVANTFDYETLGVAIASNMEVR
ncbi:MAG: AAA family ATPase [Nitrospirae bacterium]|nr:AAA family ATPase [Nitrospirota bacterium]